MTDPGTMDAIPDGTVEFNITVTIAESAKKDEVVLTVTAVSGRAAEYDLVVEEKAELTVKIFGIDKPEHHKSSTLFTFLNILFIIIIIIIILVLAIIVNNRKKRDREKKSTKEAVTVKPDEVPTAVISVGQTPAVAQLPGSAAGNVGEQTPGSTSTTPVLASSSSTAQAPASQQILQVAKLPQLPPAQSKIEGSGVEETVPEPTIVPPSPTLQRTPEESDTTQTQEPIEKIDEH